MEHLLTLQNLHVSYHTPRGTVQAVRGVDLTLDSGEVLAVVGESGCGKSALLKAIMRLLPENASVTGKILVNGTDIAPYPEKQLQKLRGSLFSMVFQDPMTALNPSMTIGAQIAEAIVVHEPKISKEALRARVLELMELVEIDRPMERMKLYPHNFSGGMRQRAVMAIALAARAKILLADEPTTALDVTIQAQILDLLRDIQEKLHTATILVSHDLGVVARAADRVAVMYAGKIVEIGTALRPAPSLHLGASARASGPGHRVRRTLHDPRHAADADRSSQRRCVRLPERVRACHRLRKRAAAASRDGHALRRDVAA